MASKLRASGLLLSVVSTANAVLFPRPFSEFETGLPPVAGAPEGVRRFAESWRKDFEDGSKMSVDWEVHTDPDSLLELDLDHSKGMRILKCSSEGLTMKVLPEHIHRLKKWRHVTGSFLLHGCTHLPKGQDLYHRVESVDEVSPLDPADGTHTVQLKTKELQSASDVFHYLRMNVAVHPIEAMDSSAVVNREERRLLGRELSGSNWLVKELKNLDLPGEFKAGSRPTYKSSFSAEHEDTDPSQSIFNFNLPQQASHFHGQSNYLANTSTDPQFMLKFSGGEGYIRFFHPFINNKFAHEVNLTSQMTSLTQPPQVYIDGKIQGTSQFKLDIATASDFEKDSSSEIMDDILKELKLNKNNLPLPFMQNVRTDGQQIQSVFHPYILHFGGTPMTITPGFECGMKLYHIGAMKGSMRLGLDATIRLEGTSHFDTNSGLMKNNFSAKAENVQFTPPTYMIITEHFELGLELLPQVFLKGGFGSKTDMKMGFGFVPYFNVTIHQQNEQQVANGDMSAVSALAIYPFRATGLPSGRAYQIAIIANGVTVKTSFQNSLSGVLEYNNNVQSYSFGAISENSLLSNPIEVQIFEDGQDQPVGLGVVTCSSMVNGECHPQPSVVNMKVRGEDVAVQLDIVWQANAMNALETKINSITAKMPGVKIMKNSLLSKISRVPDSAGLRVRINGRIITSPLTAPQNGSSILLSNARWELGPCFLDAWQNTLSETGLDNDSLEQTQSIMQLVVGGTVVATGKVPSIKWDTEPSESRYDALRQALMNPVEVDRVRAMVAMVPLYADGNAQTPVAYGRVEFDVMAPDDGSYWIYPYQAEHFLEGETYMFYWSTNGAVVGENYSFVLTALQVGSDDSIAPTDWKQKIQVMCVKIAGVTIHRYVGDVDPCIFQYQVEVPSSFVGTTAVVVVEWLDANQMPHYMATTPITFYADDRRRQRRLQVNTTAFTDASKHFQVVHSEQELAQMRAQCSATPLKFAVEAGLVYQQTMQNVRLPLPLAMMMGLSTAPDFATPPIPIWRLGSGSGTNGGPARGKALSELLPKSVCTEGMCQGVMPGCKEEQTKPIVIKQMFIRMNRVYDWTKQAGPTVRHIMAYGLSVLPSAVKITEQKMKQNLQTTASNYLQSFKTKKGRRRLDEAKDAAPKDLEMFVETPETQQDPEIVRIDGKEPEHPHPFNSFKVTLLESPGYELTEDRVRKLLEHGAFRGLEDGQESKYGPVYITDISLEDPTSEEKPLSEAPLAASVADVVDDFEVDRLDDAAVAVHQASMSLLTSASASSSNTVKSFSRFTGKSRLGLTSSLLACVAAAGAFALLVVAAGRRIGSVASNYQAVAPTESLNQELTAEFA